MVAKSGTVCMASTLPPIRGRPEVEIALAFLGADNVDFISDGIQSGMLITATPPSRRVIYRGCSLSYDVVFRQEHFYEIIERTGPG